MSGECQDIILDAVVDKAVGSLEALRGSSPMRADYATPILPWKPALAKKQWDAVIYKGLLGYLRRWLIAQPAVLSPAVPDGLAALLKAWPDELPEPLVASTIVEMFGQRLLQHIASGYAATTTERNTLELALEGYASWKELRKTQLPDLKNWLHDALIALNQAATNQTATNQTAINQRPTDKA